MSAISSPLNTSTGGRGLSTRCQGICLSVLPPRVSRRRDDRLAMLLTGPHALSLTGYLPAHPTLTHWEEANYIE